MFKLHDLKPKAVDCPAIDGIIEEAEEVSGEVEAREVLDAAIVAAAQAVEHYEITKYGTLIAWAHQLGRDDAAAILMKTLDEEKAADKKLTAVAESRSTGRPQASAPIHSNKKRRSKDWRFCISQRRISNRPPQRNRSAAFLRPSRLLQPRNRNRLCTGASSAASRAE